MPQKPKSIPKTPGVYTFQNDNGKPLYIGKAGNLKQRLSFYFSKQPKSDKINKLLEEAATIKILKTESEIEALIKESELIKKFHPKYNVLMRDDKSYFYVGITNEEFPRIFVTHQPQISSLRIANRTELRIYGGPSRTISNSPKFVIRRKIDYIGPFTDGGSLKMTLRLLRRIFPYCTCKSPHKRPCLNSEIGRCPGFCCTKLTNNRPLDKALGKQLTTYNHADYGDNIKNIIAVLQGRKGKLVIEFKRKMTEAANKQNYEKAAVFRDQALGLENIFKHKKTLNPGILQYIDVLKYSDIADKLSKLLKTQKEIIRIEGYDISNISGKEATGSMVVFTKKDNGGYAPEKGFYRQFKIKTVIGISDVDMLKEVLRRRLSHPEWAYPDLIVVDGGKPQLSAALAALAENHRQNTDSRGNFPRVPTTNPKQSVSGPRWSALSPRGSSATIVALAKREEELYIGYKRYPTELKKQPEEILHLFQRIRDESHRFAQRYHHKLRELKIKSG